jgi:toxin ParE1/3/4
MNIVFLEAAEQDLGELREYILKNFSAKTWQHTYEQIKESIRSLQRFPLAGSMPNELHELNLSQYRQLISGQNRIIYEIRQNTIYVHVISDARRDMKSLLTRRLLRI